MKFEWKDIGQDTQRAKVFGGWIVMSSADVYVQTDSGMQCGWEWKESLVFVPDANHEWDLEEL